MYYNILSILVSSLSSLSLSLSNNKGIAGILVGVNRGLFASFFVCPVAKKGGSV